MRVALLLFLVRSIEIGSVAISSRPSVRSPVAVSSTATAQTYSSLPWTDSIVPSKSLTFMPMLEMQLKLMKSLKFSPLPMKEKFMHQTSKVKPARISSLAFSNPVFRKVRLTYFDSGDSVQVFNSLWYPDYKYDLPMLGVDLISLGRSRVLTVIDFQPLHPTPDYSDKYISGLSKIRSQYECLQGTLSGKIYDDTSFFSKNMLFGRFGDESKVMTDVFPALNEYMLHYIGMATQATPNESPESQAIVQERQRAYDVYSALKDPAVGLFDAYFGKEWSSDFNHQFLFELSARDDGAYSAPVHNFKIPQQ
jgi:15,16-dihydrobiliverdin:ferredoxin oxidoreductase